MNLKALLTALSLCVVVAPALAQQPSPDKEIELHVTAREAQVIINYLSLGQWKDVNPLIVKLMGQAKTQLTPMDPPPNPEEKPH